ncbi:hypothetical protein L1987_82871 [Smallanthus sonchifolius]|uniref:Uncharacterized protein n=1 Tax=Smallanthus sonchifolius TaxID=185202 RepID=A0ACB8YFF3_9ASTR|nr:hypothetical protein L1987_82871 [Smallanthus sonchifolius]
MLNKEVVPSSLILIVLPSIGWNVGVLISFRLEFHLYFYNWNRVKLRYCDGGSYAVDAKFDNGTLVLYFGGQRIWQAIIEDLLPKGSRFAKKIDGEHGQRQK